MRRYKRVLLTLFLILGGGTFIAWQYIIPLLYRITPSGALDLYQQETMQQSIVYVLPEEKWLEFPFQSVDYLKLLTNANVPEQSKQQAELIRTNALTPEDYWSYTIQYQILNDKKEVIQDKSYYHRTRLTIYQDKNKKLYTNAKYADIANVIAADGRFILINLNKLEKARYLRVRLISKIPFIKNIIIRAYMPLQVAEHKLDSQWLRINQQAKDHLAEGTVYNASLLSNDEKRNMLKNRWQPLGPVGIKDRDYEARLLYSYQEIEDSVISEPVYPSGLLLDKQHHVVIPIAETGVNLQLKFQLLDNSKPNDVLVNVNWFGRKIIERWQKQILWLSNKPQDYKMTVKGGFIELTNTSNTPLLVEAYQGDENITPLLLYYIKSYSISQNQPLEFDIVHNGHANTAMRLSIRQILMPQSVEKTDLFYQWLDKTGEVIKQDKLLLNETLSLYDRLANTALNSLISNPNDYYFDIPPEVVKLRLQTNKGSALISAYNRYDGFIKVNKVPEDFYVSLAEKRIQPAWFNLNPNNWRELLIKNRYQLLSAQYRPPEDDLETQQLLQGTYDWQELLPVNQKIAQIALQAKEDDIPVREQALDNNYCNLAINKTIKINLQTYAHLPQIKTDIVFDKGNMQAFSLSAYIDNKLWHQSEQIGSHGVINLPLLQSGYHQIKITAPPNTKVFMNNIANCTNKSLLKRRVYPISSQNTLHYVYNKTKAEDEVLSAHFYTTHPISRTALKVKIQSDNAIQRAVPSLNWSFLQRQFDMRLQNITGAFFLYNWQQHLQQEQVFFIPLQSDLKAGEYHIEISLPEGSGYLTLSKTQAGFYENYKFYQQTNLQEIEY